MLEAVARAAVEEALAAGLGRELRLAGRALAGAALVVEDAVVRLMAFPGPDVARSSRVSRLPRSPAEPGLNSGGTAAYVSWMSV